MAAQRLVFSDQLVRHALALDGTTVRIDVPAGEHHYHFESRQGSGGSFAFHLAHPGTKLLLTGLVVARGEEAPAIDTAIFHDAPHTEAETVVRAVAFDASHPRYQGRLVLPPVAQHCQSYLSHHALLIGEQAKSWDLPCLEIEADNVRCSHAATLDTLRATDLFYPRSRGISLAEAYDLLIDAFMHDDRFPKGD